MHQRCSITAVIKAKLTQQFAAAKQEHFFTLFLDLKKACEYGVGPHALLLLCKFWAAQQLVARQCGFHGEISTQPLDWHKATLFLPRASKS